MSFCRNCGYEIDNGDIYCPNCGEKQYSEMNERYRYFDSSPKSRGALVILCVLFGYLGVHRFYSGKIGTGILWLFTGGMLGIGWFVDTILSVCGSFKDKDGFYVREWWN